MNFENVCHERNEDKVELQGYLYSANFMTMSGAGFSDRRLLVEHGNGTGGFIEIVFDDGEVFETKGQVRAFGTILKTGDSCVLSIEKLETR